MVLLVGACAGPAPTVVPDALDTNVVARFEAARALSAALDGTLYVADGSGVVALSPSGIRLGVFGGPGTGRGGLIDAVDVDPTNGQAVFVADEGGGAVVHFTAERRAVEAVLIPEVELGRGPLERLGVTVARGRPVAVARGPADALYVAEAGRALVIRLGADREVEQVLGAGLLVRPVSVAVDADGLVYVADGGLGVVQTFDAFGAAGRTLSTAAVGGPVSVRLLGRRLVVAGPETVGIYAPLGELEQVVSVEASEPLVGAVRTEAGLFVLTPTRLVRLAE